VKIRLLCTEVADTPLYVRNESNYIKIMLEEVQINSTSDTQYRIDSMNSERFYYLILSILEPINISIQSKVIIFLLSFIYSRFFLWNKIHQ
jgi:hypothetical protein